MGLTHSKGKREKHSRVERERERTYSHAPGGLRVTKGISHGVLLLLLYIRQQGIRDRLGRFSRVIRIVLRTHRASPCILRVTQEIEAGKGDDLDVTHVSSFSWD